MAARMQPRLRRPRLIRRQPRRRPPRTMISRCRNLHRLLCRRRVPTPPKINKTSPVHREPPIARKASSTRMQGNVSTRGHSSVSALGTPQGRFEKAVEDAVGSLWYYFVQQRSDLINAGTVRIEFVVSPSGEVLSARVVSNSSNETLATCSLQSVRQAKIPPMPQELIPLVPERGLEFTFSFNYM